MHIHVDKPCANQDAQGKPATNHQTNPKTHQKNKPIKKTKLTFKKESNQPNTKRIKW